MARACPGVRKAGARSIALFDANPKLGDTSACKLPDKTRLPVTFLEVDVRDDKAINAAVDKVVELHGAHDVLTNSAGIADSNLPAETYDPNSPGFAGSIYINLNDFFFMVHAVGRAHDPIRQTGLHCQVSPRGAELLQHQQGRRHSAGVDPWAAK